MDSDNYNQWISTMVHEIMHALFFDPNLFRDHYPGYNGLSFFFVDTDNVSKVRGRNILREIRSHFACPSVTAGIYTYIESIL